MMRLYFVRHGESEANILRVISNRGLYGLTAKGQQQALALAQRLKGQSVSHIYSSPLLRAVETAQILARELGLPYQITDALREYDCGVLEGKSDAASWQLHQELYRAWIYRREWERRHEQGESFLDIQRRFEPFVEGLVRQSDAAGVVLVGHGGTYALMLPLVLTNVTPEFAGEHGISNTGCVIAEVRPDGLVCVEWDSMPARVAHPTSYPDVNAVLHTLLSGVQTILGQHFIGMYVYGSLASGDFDPQRSDIDFVVVTADVLQDEMISALEALHARIAASGSKWAAKLEGAYVPQHTLRRHDPSAAPCPHINEGHFYLATLGSDWVIQRHVLREQGSIVAGPPLRTLIDPVQLDDLRRAVLGFLREWWAPMLHTPDPRLRGSEYQAYAVLTMCRALYTLQQGGVVSKAAAARWAQRTLGERWAALIEWALAWPNDPQPDRMGETLDFIRYTLERSQQFGKPVE